MSKGFCCSEPQCPPLETREVTAPTRQAVGRMKQVTAAVFAQVPAGNRAQDMWACCSVSPPHSVSQKWPWSQVCSVAWKSRVLILLKSPLGYLQPHVILYAEDRVQCWAVCAPWTPSPATSSTTKAWLQLLLFFSLYCEKSRNREQWED